MIKLIIFDIDGVITDGKVRINHEGEEFKLIDFKDIDAIFELKQKGYKIAFITGENTDIVNYFKNKFEPDYFYSGYKDKLLAIKEIENKEDISKEEICYIGDSKHDLLCIQYCGVGVCPNDAINDAKKVSNYVLNKNAGNGAINELLNLLDNYNKSEDERIFEKVYQEHMDVFRKMKSNIEMQNQIMRSVEVIIETFKGNGQILICGNGGSAADAQHIATEFVSRFYLERKALNAEAITVNSSSVTAIGNDYDFSRIFSRQVEAKGKSGDILIGISTSGNSKNVVEAVKAAKSIGMKTIIFTGGNQECELKIGDIVINVPSNITPRIQEVHIFIGHMICEYVENILFGDGKDE